MARMIDASRFGEIMEQWKKDCLECDHQLEADVIADVILQLDDMPTLTQPNEWVSVEERLPEPGGLIVYANKYGNVALYGVLRVAKNDRPNRYDYWACLPELPDRRPPEGEA